MKIRIVHGINSLQKSVSDILTGKLEEELKLSKLKRC